MSDTYRKRLVVILQGTALSAASAPESLDSFTSAYEWLRGSPAHSQPRVAPRSLNHGWFGTARWKAVGCSDATSTPWCSEWCGHCRRHSAALQASAITSETTTRASGTRRRSCRCTSARTTFSACSVSDCRQPAPAHAILWITSAHTALRVASGLIGSRIRCSTRTGFGLRIRCSDCCVCCSAPVGDGQVHPRLLARRARCICARRDGTAASLP